jgi:hypothetical protein
MQYDFIFVQSVKINSGDAGHRFSFKKLDLEFIDSDAAFCVATELFVLSKHLKLKLNSPFFTADNEN